MLIWLPSANADIGCSRDSASNGTESLRIMTLLMPWRHRPATMDRIELSFLTMHSLEVSSSRKDASRVEHKDDRSSNSAAHIAASTPAQSLTKAPTGSERSAVGLSGLQITHRRTDYHWHSPAANDACAQEGRTLNGVEALHVLTEHQKPAEGGVRVSLGT
jgi:hypothetical protein